ncbi:hypothetical protein ACT7CW_12865 [Bacillus pacificus]
MDETAEEDARQLKEILDNPIPYGKIKFIPEIINKMESSIQAVLEEKKRRQKKKLSWHMTTFLYWQSNMEYQAIRKNKLSSIMLNWRIRLDSFTDIYKVDATISQSDSFKERYEGIINQEITEWKKRQKPEVIIDGGGEVEPPVQKEKIRASELVGVKILRSEGDVDQYINTLSNKLKQIIKSNKEIEFID